MCSVSSISIDPRAALVSAGDRAVKLTSHEYRVLSYLAHHRGRVVSQPELTEHIYAQSFDRDSNTVEVFIARLRRKLGAHVIETVRGLVAAGLGVALLTHAEFAPPPGLRELPLTPRTGRIFGLTWLRDHPLPPAVRAFREHALRTHGVQR